MTLPPQLVCLGRAAVDLYAEERGSGLDEAVWFRKSLGGSAANTAVAAARQGLRVAMLTVVGRDPFGDFVRRALAEAGVDVSAVRADPSRLTGLVVLGMRGPEDAPHMFYRNDCADMGLAPSDVEAMPFDGARALLLTGTHLATPGTLDASRRAVARARAAGAKIVLDVDYRPSLWGAAPTGSGEARAAPSPRAVRTYREIIPACDLVIGTEDEIRVASGADDVVAGARALLDRGAGRVVTKLGPRGARSLDAGGEAHALDGLRVQVVNAIGAGDAFSGAYLAAWIRGEDAPTCLALGNAAGAVVAARPGCAPAMPTRDEIEPLTTSHTAAVVPNDEQHWRATRPAPPERLLILALDHRAHFEALLGDAERISRVKALIFAGGRAAFADAGVPEAETGFIVDAEYGASLLAPEPGRFRARPIEVPSEDEPLAFAGGADVALELLRWPARQAVKCKVVYHPDASAEVCSRQESLLLTLQRACRALDRTLLLEVVPALDGREDFRATARAVERLYDAGLAPEWWKLPPPVDELASAAVDRVVLERDPGCSGVLLLGNGLEAEELRRRLAWARRSPVCRGFAFGRTVFAEAAQAWAQGRIGDDEVTARVRARMAELIRLWSSDAD